MTDMPVATLFMLMSADGKISTGKGVERDFDKDLPNVPGVSEGLRQYYDLEQETDSWSLNTGKVMAKVGWNEPKEKIEYIPVTFVLIDNEPHLTSQGVANLLQRTKKLVIVTTNPEHPALKMSDEQLEVIQCKDVIDFRNLFQQLKGKGADRLTIQSGGELNATLARHGLITYVSVVVAPLLVGGKDTPTLLDGKSLETSDDLKLLKPMKLISADALKSSYLHLQYELTPVND